VKNILFFNDFMRSPPKHDNSINFHARFVQHECDHLDGILFPQRIKDLRYFGFEDEINRINIFG